MNVPFQKVALVALLAVACCFTESCRYEGCTDKEALNYNSVANHDDGSCMYCDQMYVEGEVTVDIRDDNFSSQFFNQVVARAYLRKEHQDYLFSKCGTDTCKVFYYVQNLTPHRISFNYNFFFGSSQFTNSEFVNIQANQTSPIDSFTSLSFSSFSNLCSFVAPGLVSVELNTTIDYF